MKKMFKEYKIFSNEEELAVYVGSLWRTLQAAYTKTGLFFVSSPLSSTPLPLYTWVINHSKEFENWSRFQFVLMDEQVEQNHDYHYVPLSDAACYERFAREKFLDPLQAYTNIDTEQILLKPYLNDLNHFSKMLEEHKGIDLLILAIGTKGHYAQVMPGTPLETDFHIARLIPQLAQTHTRKGSQTYKGAQFSSYGMSLGPKQVVTAKNIILMITGSNKKELARQLFAHDSFDPEFPISIIYNPLVAPKTHVLLTKDVGASIIHYS